MNNAAGKEDSFLCLKRGDYAYMRIIAYHTKVTLLNASTI
jgi:hypothetical protein